MFEKKGKAEEKKEALNQELVFKASIKRNKIVGNWIGKDILGLSGDSLENFIDQTIDSDFEEKGDEDVINFLLKQVENFSDKVSENDIRKKMDIEFKNAYEDLKNQD